MTLLLALFACGSADHAHGPDADHDHDGHAAEVKQGRDAPADAVPAAGPIEADLEDHRVRLEPAAESLRVVVLDPAGAPVAAQGEARVVLTGTGEEAQRLVLAADGDAWSGAAQAAGAPGYLAVVTVEVAGTQRSARLTWGEVPETAPAPHEHDDGDHGHGDDGGHGHPH